MISELEFLFVTLAIIKTTRTAAPHEILNQHDMTFLAIYNRVHRYGHHLGQHPQLDQMTGPIGHLYRCNARIKEKHMDWWTLNIL